MLIYLYGPDSFLARAAINSLKQKYLEKNPTGSELVEIDADADSPNWADLKALPLFATSRLVIIRRAGELVQSEQDSLAAMLTDLPTSTIVVLWDSKPLKVGGALATILDSASKKVSVESLTGSRLAAWTRRQAESLSIALSGPELTQLTNQYGSNLWAIQTDLMARQGTQALSEWGQTASDKPFILFDYVRGRRWLDLKRHLLTAFERGEAVELTIGSLAAALRQSVKDDQARKKMVSLISEIDQALKTGLLEPADAVALLACYLPDSQNRVQWEELCLELS